MPRNKSKKCKRAPHDNSNNSTLTSESVDDSTVLKMRSRKTAFNDPNRDFLPRLFEKKKLKDKSLSKKLQTPFDRKLNRSCWPIRLKKVSKIKKKPKEKKKKKPNYKCIQRKKQRKVDLVSDNQSYKSILPYNDSKISFSSDIDEILDDELTNLNENQFLYEPITPQMLIDVLRDPDHLNSGATLEMIVAKLRTLKLDLNLTTETLEEVLKKLQCAITLGMIVKKKGRYRVVKRFRVGKLPRKSLDAFWNLWYKNVGSSWQ